MNNFSTLEEAYLQGLANGITQAHLNLTIEKTRDRQCSRRNCPLQRTTNENDFNDDKCRKHCEWYTPKITKEDTMNILETLNLLKIKRKKMATMRKWNCPSNPEYCTWCPYKKYCKYYKEEKGSSN